MSRHLTIPHYSHVILLFTYLQSRTTNKLPSLHKRDVRQSDGKERIVIRCAMSGVTDMNLAEPAFYEIPTVGGINYWKACQHFPKTTVPSELSAEFFQPTHIQLMDNNSQQSIRLYIYTYLPTPLSCFFTVQARKDLGD